MAGDNCDSFNNKQLWHLISGTGFLRPEKYVELEIEKNKTKLQQGISFYKDRDPKAGGDVLKKGRKLTESQNDFVLKLSQLLSLDVFQSHDLFCAFLLNEFRGSQKELKNILSNERHSQTLLIKIRDFYYSDRLYLLRCLRQLLLAWVEESHAYKDVYDKFLKKSLENNLLGKQLLIQWDKICSTPTPDKETHGPLMTQGLVMSWILHNLKEQTELLELMVIYYKYLEMDGNMLVTLCEKFKKHLFGWGQSFKHLVNKDIAVMIQRIGYLEVILLLESFDLSSALDGVKANNLSDHVILGDKKVIKQVNSVMTKLGSEPIHGPLLLGWAVIKYIQAEDLEGQQENVESDETIREARMAFQHFGNSALQLGAFDMLFALIDTEPFNGKTNLGFIVHSTVFYLVSGLLSIFHEDSLGNTDALYCIAAKLFQWDAIAEMVWNVKNTPEGLTTLFDSSRQLFPLDFACFMKFSISLAQAGPSSVKQLKSCLVKMKGYTELLDCNRAQDLEVTPHQNVFKLRRNKHPVENSDFIIQCGVQGELLDITTLKAGLAIHHVIQWDVQYNGWHYLMAQIQALLTQVSHGAGMVQTEQVIKVSLVMELIKEVMTSDPQSVLEFTEIISLCYQLILRFSVLNPAPVELLGHTIQCLALATPHMPDQITHHLKQTGLLPFLTENIDNFSEVLTGDGINQGVYGCVLASTECPQGVYPVTIAVLELVTRIVTASTSSSSQTNNQSEHLASVLFILRDIFPAFHKWRYVDLRDRKVIGQKCLQLFHKVLNFGNRPKSGQEESKKTLTSSTLSLSSLSSLPSSSAIREKKKGPSLQECCVFSLLFTEAGRALLDIVGTGVDNVQQALAQQTSLNEGSGVDMMELIEMSLSLLNRLLLLKHPDLGVSPVEAALSSQPPGQQHQRHLVLVIAQYIYHRHSHRLPTLATLLLKRLAMVSPMSILACLGNEADAIRDMYLTRLQAVSEDVQLRVGILELLSVCVESQPGLIEIFLNVVQQQQQQQQKSGLSKDSTTSNSKKPGLTLGARSCLPIILDVIAEDKQYTYECPPGLLCAALDFLHALWAGMRETPMAVLREKTSFWPSVLAPLKSDLPEFEPQDPQPVQVYKLKSKIVSYAVRITALEIYATSSSKLETNFKSSLESVFAKSRLQYWSETMKKTLQTAAQNDDTDSPDKAAVTDTPTPLILLLAWKNLLITAARFKVSEIGLDDKVKAKIFHDLLAGIREQFRAGEMTQLKVKLASVASALYFTLIKMWGKELFSNMLEVNLVPPRTVSEPLVIVRNLVRVLEESCSNSDKLPPSIPIGLLVSVLTTLQQYGNSGDCCPDLPEVVSSLLPVVCSVFQQSTRQLTTLVETTSHGVGDETQSPEFKALGAHIKLQVVSLCLVLEVLQLGQNVDLNLKVIQEEGILSSLLATTQAFMTGKQGISYIYSSLLLLSKIAETEKGASMLLMNNLTSHLCMALTMCYSSDESTVTQASAGLQKVFSSLRPSEVGWQTLYCLTLDLFATMLRMLKHAFLENTLNLVGVHQDRMQMALLQAQVNLSPSSMKEAESTINVFLQLSMYQRQWKFLLPDVLIKLRSSLVSLLQTYSALIIRPRYLMHILGQSKSSEGASKQDSMLQTSAFLQQQTSLDDVEQPSSRLVETQHRMLVIIGKSLSCLRQFSPNLIEIMMDQSVDVTEWEDILDLTFSTPTLDGPTSNVVSFGTLLYLTTTCIRHLAKNDTRSTSPHRSPLDANKASTSNTSTTNTIPKHIIYHVLDTSLDLLMSQACRYLRDGQLTPRERQYLKRELGTEMNLFLSSFQRQLRRGGSSSVTPPQTSQPTSSSIGVLNQSASNSTQTTQVLSRTLSTTSFPGGQEPGFIRLAQAFVQQVLR